MKKIIIVDDHELITIALKNYIESKLKYEVIKIYKNGKELLEDFKNHKPDLIILDLNMPIKDGYDTLADLKYYYPDSKILILSNIESDETAIRTIRSGANGFCKKSEDMDVILGAIRNVIEGQDFISKNLTNYLIKNYRDGNQTNSILNRLTDRETQVLKSLIEGLTQQQISNQLNLSIKTISTYKRSIMTKFNVNNEIELLKFCKNNDIEF